MKRLLFLLALTACFFSCQDMGEDLTLGHADQGVPATKSVSISEIAEIDEVYTYKCLDDPDIWRKLGPLEERFEAFQIPDSVLTRMTTSALVKTVLHYPLNALLFAYNDPADWVEIVLQYSNLHAELLKRKDMFSEMIDAFSKTNIRMDGSTVSHKMQGNDVTYADEMFVANFIAYIHKSGLTTFEDNRILSEVVSQKIAQRSASSGIFGDYTLLPLRQMGLMCSNVANDSLTIRSQLVSVSSTSTITTPFGKSIEVLILPEMTQSEINWATNDCLSQYPNVTLIRPASQKYNCHSYAWYSTAADNSYWINAGTQLSKYWTNDLYVSCTSSEAEKIYYANGDHSALPSTTAGKYISKWGAWPLVEHAPTDCPYLATNMQYYKERPTPLYVNITGPSIVEVGGEYLYQTNPSIPITWNIYTALSSPNEYNYHVQGGGAMCVLVVKQSGGFAISGNSIYYNGRLVLQTSSLTVVTSDLLKTSKDIEQLEDENTEDMPVSL